VRDDRAFGRARDDIGESTAAVDPELPAILLRGLHEMAVARVIAVRLEKPNIAACPGCRKTRYPG
jgi:hypothetical protein